MSRGREVDTEANCTPAENTNHLEGTIRSVRDVVES